MARFIACNTRGADPDAATGLLHAIGGLALQATMLLARHFGPCPGSSSANKARSSSWRSSRIQKTNTNRRFPSRWKLSARPNIRHRVIGPRDANNDPEVRNNS